MWICDYTCWGAVIDISICSLLSHRSVGYGHLPTINDLLQMKRWWSISGMLPPPGWVDGTSIEKANIREHSPQADERDPRAPCRGKSTQERVSGCFV